MIKCHNINVSYPIDQDNSYQAISNVSIDIKEAEFTAIIGPNGSGKSTLALAMSGLQIAQSGSISIDNTDINVLLRSRSLYDLMGIVFQNPDDQLVTNFVEREIAFGLENRGVPRSEIVRRIDRILEEFNYSGLKNRSPFQLSGGQKQKLALASVLVANPKYLILDEPTSFLDSLDRKTIFAQLRKEIEEQKREGFSVILITQFSREAVQCDRVVVLNQGSIVADGFPDVIFSEMQELLQEIGVEIPVEYRLKKACPEIQLPKALFNYSVNM